MRDSRRAGQLAAQGLQPVVGDLTNPAILDQFVADCDAIVHAAGAVRGARMEDFDSINRTGTSDLVAAAMRQPRAPRFLLISSLAAREPGLSWYASSKRAAEQVLEQTPSLDWTILRPPPVYGPGDREMLPVFRWMARGLAPVPGDIHTRTSLIHVRDLAAAVVSSLESDQVSHRLLYLCDDREAGYDWPDLAAAVSQVSGRPVRLWRVPPALLDAVAGINIWWARLTRRSPMLTPPKLRELRHPDWVVDNSEITAATGWRPEISLHGGLVELLGGEE